MLNEVVISSIADLRFKHTQKEVFFTIHWAPSKIGGPRPKSAVEMYVGCWFPKPKGVSPLRTLLPSSALALGPRAFIRVKPQSSPLQSLNLSKGTEVVLGLGKTVGYSNKGLNQSHRREQAPGE